MGLASGMKNLSEEILASFKNRIKENEELVSEVQKTLDSFRKDHQEMASILNANAMDLRKKLTIGEKDRMKTYNGLMSGINTTISSIQKEVMEIQTSTFNLIHDFASDRKQMAAELSKFFAGDRAERAEDEKTRMEEFNVLMKNINDDIKSINNEVLAIFKDTNEMLQKFDNEHRDMSADLRTELAINLTDRVEYTKALVNRFQKRLSEIGKENKKMALKLRKDLDSGESTRLDEYKGLMKDMHASIKGIRKEVKDISKETAGMLGDLLKERIKGSAEWNKMQGSIAEIRKTGLVVMPNEVAVKNAKKKLSAKEIRIESAKDIPVGSVVEIPVKVSEKISMEEVKKVPAEVPIKIESEQVTIPMTLEGKVLDFINKHPKGVKVSEMEEPLGESRMKLGFTAKALLDDGKVQKIENVYFPVK